MLPRKFISFLLAVKMAASQNVYPSTQISYSTNAVPTVQTYTVPSGVATAMPAMTATATSTAISATAMPATVSTATPTTYSATAIPAMVTKATPTTYSATAIPATTATATPTTYSATSMPATASVTAIPSSISPTVTLAPSQVSVSPSTVMSCSSAPKVSISSASTNPTEPKAYFLPANIPDPKVTILSNDLPNIEVKPAREVIEAKATVCPDYYATPIKRKEGPLTAAKRITMACTDDVMARNEDPLCPSILKMEPPPGISKDIKGNPIDFEGLFEGFMTCL